MTALAPVLGFGSRTWTDQRLIHHVLHDTWHDATQLGYLALDVIEGTAEGADSLCGAWAVAHEPYGVKHTPMEADWEGPCVPACRPGHRRTRRDGTTYCPTAGHRRNQAMVDLRPLLGLAFHLGGSTGTADCLRRLAAARIPVRRFTA